MAAVLALQPGQPPPAVTLQIACSCSPRQGVERHQHARSGGGGYWPGSETGRPSPVIAAWRRPIQTPSAAALFSKLRSTSRDDRHRGSRCQLHRLAGCRAFSWTIVNLRPSPEGLFIYLLAGTFSFPGFRLALNSFCASARSQPAEPASSPST